MNELLTNIENYIVYIKQSNYSENTVIAYELATRYLYSYIKHFNLDYLDLKGSDLMQMRAEMLKEYKASTINLRLTAMHSFFEYLIDIDKLSINPIRRSLYIRINRKKPKPLSDPEERILLNYLNTKPMHVRLAYKVLLESGIRLSELKQLREESFKVINGKYYIEIFGTKNNANRIVPIKQYLYKQIKQYIKDYIAIGLLFNLSERGYQYYADQFQEKFNIEFSVHSCRHTYATKMARQGLPIQIIQKLLGHKDISTTMYYVDISDEDILNLNIEPI